VARGRSVTSGGRTGISFRCHGGDALFKVDLYAQRLSCKRYRYNELEPVTSSVNDAHCSRNDTRIRRAEDSGRLRHESVLLIRDADQQQQQQQRASERSTALVSATDSRRRPCG